MDKTLSPLHSLHPGIPLTVDMAAFDEAGNPWRTADPETLPGEAERFLARWTDPGAVQTAFPELGQAFLPFRDPRREAAFTPSERARGLAKAVLQMHSGLPRYLVVEAAAGCQLACPFCSSHDIAVRRRSPIMDFASFSRLWRHAGFFTHSLDFTGGEPLLNPDLAAMIALARADGAYVSLSTNGLLLDPARIAELLAARPAAIVVSCDGASASEYEAARVGGDFGLLCKNVRTLARAARRRGPGRTLVGLRFLATRRNFASRHRYWELVRELGVDYGLLRHFRIPPDADAALRKRLLREEAVLGEPESCYRLDADGDIAILKDSPGCTRSRHPGYVGSGGEVLACSFFPRDEPLGNAVDQPFAAVWLADAVVARRQKAIREGLHEGCRWCPGVWREEWYEERWNRQPVFPG